MNALAAVAHASQIHPDYRYCVTLDGKPHHDITGWEPNPAMHSGYRGRADADQYRPEYEPRERYWMLRVNPTDAGEVGRVTAALHRARKHPGFEYLTTANAPVWWERNPNLPPVCTRPPIMEHHYMRRVCPGGAA